MSRDQRRGRERGRAGGDGSLCSWLKKGGEENFVGFVVIYRVPPFAAGDSSDE